MAMDLAGVVSLQDLVNGRLSGDSELSRRLFFAAGQYKRLPYFAVKAEHLEEVHKSLFKEYQGALTQDHGEGYHIVFHDALVVGQGAVITKEGYLIQESVVEFLAHGNVPDGLQRESGRYIVPDAVQREIDRPSLLLQRPWYLNYGHWLVDGASILAINHTLNLPEGWHAVVGLQSGRSLRNVVYQSAGILAPGVGLVERPPNAVWRFKELHYVTPVHVPPVFKLPSAVTSLRSVIGMHATMTSRTASRIYVIRGSQESRALDNEDEVTNVLSSCGFTLYSPVGKTIVDQAAAFQNADIVVGVKGAALTNAIFCRAGAHVVALSPGDFPDPFFWDLVSQCSIYYSEIFGPRIDQRSGQGRGGFRIDVKSLLEVLNLVEASLRSKCS